MTHSLETAQISRTIARGLRLNEDLVEAIALGHDVGHTPFSHAGEEALKEILGHYAHNEQSLRVVECLERDGQGLNLTRAVKDGIANHTGPNKPYTLEGNIVRIGDRIARRSGIFPPPVTVIVSFGQLEYCFICRHAGIAVVIVNNIIEG